MHEEFFKTKCILIPGISFAYELSGKVTFIVLQWQLECSLFENKLLLMEIHEFA